MIKSELVLKIAEKKLEGPKSQHIGRYHQLAAIGIGLAQARADALQPWQHDVYSEGVDRDESGDKGNEFHRAQTTHNFFRWHIQILS